MAALIRGPLRLAFRMLRAAAMRALATAPRPGSPIVEPWELSIAVMARQLVRPLPLLPWLAGLFLDRFDTFARVAIAPDRVGFDDKTVRWDKVIELRVYPSTRLLPAVVIDREVDRVRKLLPPVPGRKWMVTKASHVLTFAAALFLQGTYQHRATPPLPCQILYRGRFGRQDTLTAGLFAAIVLAAMPEASHSLISTAQALAIPVRVLPDPTGSVHATEAAPLRHIHA